MESEASAAACCTVAVNKNATKIECLQLNIWEALHYLSIFILFYGKA